MKVFQIVMRGSSATTADTYKKPYTRASAHADVDERHAEVMCLMDDVRSALVTVGSRPVPLPTPQAPPQEDLKPLLLALQEKLDAVTVAVAQLTAAQKSTHSKVVHSSGLLAELHASQDGMAAALLDVLKPYKKRVRVSDEGSVAPQKMATTSDGQQAISNAERFQLTISGSVVPQ